MTAVIPNLPLQTVTYTMVKPQPDMKVMITTKDGSIDCKITAVTCRDGIVTCALATKETGFRNLAKSKNSKFILVLDNDRWKVYGDNTALVIFR